MGCIKLSHAVLLASLIVSLVLLAFVIHSSLPQLAFPLLNFARSLIGSSNSISEV